MCCCGVLTPPPPLRIFLKSPLLMASFFAAAGMFLSLQSGSSFAFVEVYGLAARNSSSFRFSTSNMIISFLCIGISVDFL